LHEKLNKLQLKFWREWLTVTRRRGAASLLHHPQHQVVPNLGSYRDYLSHFQRATTSYVDKPVRRGPDSLLSATNIRKTRRINCTITVILQ
jgi:hypothetical protein